MQRLEDRFPIYSRIFSLYPAPYRLRYRDEALQTIADMLDDSASSYAGTLLKVRIGIDLAINLIREQLCSVGDIMREETPKYVTYSSLIAGAMLVPFFLAIIANGTDKIMHNQTLFHSWLWSTPFITLWVVRLPELALIISLTSFLLYVFRRQDKQAGLWVKRLLDVRRSWPVLVPAAVALGILGVLLFHDSGQCVLRSPGFVFGHAQQTLNCVLPSSKLVRHLFV